MSSRWNTRPQTHGSGSTLHSSLESVRMLSIWSGKAGCFGMETCWKVSGLCGTRNCTCVPISVVELVWADSPKFLGNGYGSDVARVGVGRRGQSCYRCGGREDSSGASPGSRGERTERCSSGNARVTLLINVWVLVERKERKKKVKNNNFKDLKLFFFPTCGWRSCIFQGFEQPIYTARDSQPFCLLCFPVRSAG